MSTVVVTRAQLKNACEQCQWDLLDRLLEIDSTHIDDSALFTDTWGTWWGMLIEVILKNEADGVRVLLKHGARRNAATWGDCIPETALELAQDRPTILELLKSSDRPTYVRRTDPPLPLNESAEDRAVNRQGDIHTATGLVFPLAAIDPDEA